MSSGGRFGWQMCQLVDAMGGGCVGWWTRRVADVSGGERVGSRISLMVDASGGGCVGWWTG